MKDPKTNDTKTVYTRQEIKENITDRIVPEEKLNKWDKIEGGEQEGEEGYFYTNKELFEYFNDQYIEAKRTDERKVKDKEDYDIQPHENKILPDEYKNRHDIVYDLEQVKEIKNHLDEIYDS